MDIPRETAKVEISIVAASTHDNIIESIFFQLADRISKRYNHGLFLEGND